MTETVGARADANGAETKLHLLERVAQEDQRDAEIAELRAVAVLMAARLDQVEHVMRAQAAVLASYMQPGQGDLEERVDRVEHALQLSGTVVDCYMNEFVSGAGDGAWPRLS